jgi:hypothetical protein
VTVGTADGRGVVAGRGVVCGVAGSGLAGEGEGGGPDVPGRSLGGELGLAGASERARGTSPPVGAAPADKSGAPLGAARDAVMSQPASVATRSTAARQATGRAGGWKAQPGVGASRVMSSTSAASEDPTGVPGNRGGTRGVTARRPGVGSLCSDAEGASSRSFVLPRKGTPRRPHALPDQAGRAECATSIADGRAKMRRPAYGGPC